LDNAEMATHENYDADQVCEQKRERDRNPDRHEEKDRSDQQKGG
jgi:hypothetical protein